MQNKDNDDFYYLNVRIKNELSQCYFSISLKQE